MSISKRFLAQKGLDNNNYTLVNVADPVNPQDAATKAFSTNANNLTTGTIAGSILGNSTLFVGTTAITLNRASGSQALTGIASIDGNAATASKLAAPRSLSTSGDVTFSLSFDGSANVSGPAVLATTGVSAGTYNNVTVDAKGRVTSGATASYLVTNQPITISGDASGTGATSMILTLATVNANPVSNAFHKITTNAKGLVTTSQAVGASDITTALGFTPFSIQGGTLQGSVTATQFTGSGAGLTSIPNTALVNSQVTVGTTAISLGSSSTTLAGLTSVTSSQFIGTLTGSITGNAPTASQAAKLGTAQLISATGDATWSTSFDGSATATGTLTLASTGVAAGTFGSNAGVIPVFTVDLKGRLTGVANTPIASLPAGVSTTGLLSSAANVTAAGTTGGTATLLTADISTVTSATSGSAYCVLVPTPTQGRKIVINNRSTTAITVWPNTGAIFDAGVANGPLTLPVNTSVEMIALDATHWTTSLQRINSGASLAAGSVPLTALAQSGIVIGSTAIQLGATAATLAGLTSVAATTFTGALTGNASSASAASTVSVAADTGANGLYSMVMAPTPGSSGTYLPKIRANVTYDTTNNVLNLPGYLQTFNGIFNNYSSTGNNIIQTSVNALGSGLGLLATTSANSLYTTGGLAINVGTTISATGTPTGGVTGVMILSNGKVGFGNINPSYQVDITGTARATAFIGDGSQLTNISVAATSAPLLSVIDSRSVNAGPGAYGMGIHADFKLNTTDALVDDGAHGTGYHGVLTFQQYSDASGGGINQLGFSTAGNLWMRTAAPVDGSSTNGWSAYSAWRKFSLLNANGSETISVTSAAGSTTMATYAAPNNASQLTINSSNAAGAYLTGAAAGDTSIRTETGNLRLGTLGSTGVIGFGTATANYGSFTSIGLNVTNAIFAAGSTHTTMLLAESGSPSGGSNNGYILLARAYTTGNVADSSVVGRLIVRRGGTAAGLRQDMYDVVSRSAYQTEQLWVKVYAGQSTFFQATVKVTYGGVVYHAIQHGTTGGDASQGVTFSGTSVNAGLLYVDSTSVSAVSTFGIYEYYDTTTANHTNPGSLVSNKLVASSVNVDPGWGGAGDIVATRNNGTGVLYLGSASTYLYFDGTKYNLPNTPLYVNGQQVVTGVATDLYGNTANAVTRAYVSDSSNDFNSLTDFSRVASLNATANTPFGNDWYTFYNARHRGGAGSDGVSYGSQIAIGMTSSNFRQRLAFRTQSGGTWGGWTEALTTFNYGSYALPNTATNTIYTGTLTINPTTTGSYVEGLRIMANADGYCGVFLGADSSGSGSIATQISLLRNSSNNFEVRNGAGSPVMTTQQNGSGTYAVGGLSGDRVYAGYDSGVTGSISCNSWFRVNGNTGLYNSTYATGVYWAGVGANGTNSFSHGSIATYGTTGSYCGFSLAGVVTLISNVPAAGNSGTWGFYNDVQSIWMMSADYAGNVTFNGNVTAYSDRRLKKDITPIANARQRFMANVRGVEYTRIDTNAREMGVVAQDVQKGFDVLVHETKKDADSAETVLSVNYNGLIAPMIEVVREHDDEIERLKQQLAYEQRERLIAEVRLAKLEKLVAQLIGE